MPALEEQGPIARVSREHRERHVSARSDAAPDAELRLLTLAVALVVGIPACKAALTLHVFSACLCGVLRWTAPRTGDAGPLEAVGQSRIRDTPAQRAARPWGPWSRVKTVIPGRGYSIGEAAGALWRIRDAVWRSWTDHRRVGKAACCQQPLRWIFLPGRSLAAVTGKRRALAERRRVVGYTQEQLAVVLDVERSTVVRWEAGDTTPQPWCRPKLAEALAVSVDELDAMLAEGQAEGVAGQLCDLGAADELPDGPEYEPILTAPWNHRGTVDAVVMLSGGGWVKRRVFLSLTGTALTAPAHQWLVHEPEPLVSGLSGRRISADMVCQLTAMIAELRKMDDIAGGGSVLSLAQHEFSWVAGLLDQAVYDERTGQMLFVPLAELGQLCGWAAYDAGHHALAQRYYVAALRATHSADDRPLGAHVLSCMAEQAARQGQPAEAVTLIETALAGMQGRQIPSLLAELYGRQAYAFATVGDVPGCVAVISKLRTQIEQLTPDAGPSWLYWVNPAHMTCEVGNALRQLGHTEQAAVMLKNGIAMYDDSLPVGQAGYLIALADVRARRGKQRDLDVAASHGMEAIQLTETLDSPRLAGLIRNLYHQMTPHAKVPAVGDFLERARGLVTV